MSNYFDMHCHLLYGVDDGPKELEASLQLLRQEYDDGVRTVYLTPHFRKNMFECSAEVIREHFEILQARAKQELPELCLRLGCEIHVSMDVAEEIKSGRCATLGGTEFVLLEFSETAEKKYILDRCHAVMNRGFAPIIAHAERCAAIRKDTKDTTVFIVSQRASSLIYADKIIVLSHGKIIEEGDHAALLAKRGHYYGLYQMQFEKERLKNA